MLSFRSTSLLSLLFGISPVLGWLGFDGVPDAATYCDIDHNHNLNLSGWDAAYAAGGLGQGVNMQWKTDTCPLVKHEDPSTSYKVRMFLVNVIKTTVSKRLRTYPRRARRLTNPNPPQPELL